jgi:hypothetical protein
VIIVLSAIFVLCGFSTFWLGRDWCWCLLCAQVFESNSGFKMYSRLFRTDVHGDIC